MWDARTLREGRTRWTDELCTHLKNAIRLVSVDGEGAYWDPSGLPHGTWAAVRAVLCAPPDAVAPVRGGSAEPGVVPSCVGALLDAESSLCIDAPGYLGTSAAAARAISGASRFACQHIIKEEDTLARLAVRPAVRAAPCSDEFTRLQLISAWKAFDMGPTEENSARWTAGRNLGKGARGPQHWVTPLSLKTFFTAAVNADYFGPDLPASTIRVYEDITPSVKNRHCWQITEVNEAIDYNWITQHELRLKPQQYGGNTLGALADEEADEPAD